MAIHYDLVSAEEIEAAFQIEVASYPADEAASLEAFQYRQAQAPELFLGAFLPERELVGYICSTLSSASTLTHHSMETHEPGATTVCVHSVCVSSAHRGRGLGGALVREYLVRLAAAAAAAGTYERVCLIAHEPLVSFYQSAGLELVGPSAVTHGALPWFELRKVFSASDAAAAAVAAPAPAVPDDIWAALQRSSNSTGRPSAQLLKTFPGGVGELVEGEKRRNRLDLLCPRAGCGSVILKAGVAAFAERASVPIDLDDQDPVAAAAAGKRPACLGELPKPPAEAQWWLVSGSPMLFENIGFSKAVELAGPGRPKTKLLTCAECDLAPLGWCEEGGSEYWLACNRVGYRV